MIIKELYLEDFGKFKQKTIELQPGLNLIYGDNEAGKTTVSAFVRAMLFGLERKRGRGSEKDDYSRYAPWDSPDCYRGMMRFEMGGVSYRMERNFYWGKKSVAVICEEDGRVLKEEEIKTVFGGFSEPAYSNTVNIGQLGTKPGEELADVFRDYVINLSSTKNAELNMNRAIAELAKRKKEILSEGKPEQLQETRTVYARKRAEKEGCEQRETELCAQMEEKRGKRDCLEEQWDKEKHVEDKARNELADLQLKAAGLLEKQKNAAGEQKQLEEECGKLQQEIQDGRYALMQEYQFETPDGAAAAIAATKRKSVFAWMPFFILCMFLAFTAVALILRLDYLYLVCGCLGMIWSLIWFILGIRHKEKKKNQRLDYLDEGRLRCLRIMEEEKHLTQMQEEILKKDEQIGSLQMEIHQNELIVKEKTEHLPEASKALLTEKGQLESELQKSGWELEQVAHQKEELEEEMAVLQRRIRRLRENEEEIAAIDQAIINIGQVAETIKGSFGVELNKRASAYISMFTKGKYRQLTIDDRMNITVYEGNNRRAVEQLSKGTIEQMYLALRLAAADIIFSEEKKPILLDDALVMYDNKRMAETLACMAEKTEQVLLFSCHTRERAVLDARKVPYSFIRI